MSYITCKICGDKLYHAKFTNHIIEEHGICPQDYYETFISGKPAPLCRCGRPLRFKKLSDPYYKTCGNPNCTRIAQSENLTQLNSTEEFQEKAHEALLIKWNSDERFREFKKSIAIENINKYVNEPGLTIEQSRKKIVARAKSLSLKYPKYLLYLIRLLDNYNDCIKLGVCRITDKNNYLNSKRIKDYSYYFDKVELISLWLGDTEDILILESEVITKFYDKYHKSVSFGSQETFILDSESIILNYINERSSTIEKVIDTITLVE